MPYLKIQTNQSLDPAATQALLAKASQTAATELGKPEHYVMVSLHSDTPMLFAGSQEPCAYLELKSLGLPDDITANLSQALCTLLAEEIGLDPGRIYIEFASPDRHMWGWNSSTF
jgi:phenylpyruvate tautomerase PptA (4-oxalocrotonate tautomerase family)